MDFNERRFEIEFNRDITDSVEQLVRRLSHLSAANNITCGLRSVEIDWQPRALDIIDVADAIDDFRPFEIIAHTNYSEYESQEFFADEEYDDTKYKKQERFERMANG